MFVFANIKVCRHTILVYTCVFKGLYKKVDKYMYHSTRCYDIFSYNSKSVLC